MSVLPYIDNGIRINGVTLNSLAQNDNCVWVLSDIVGWHGLPDIDAPEDGRPSHEDGSYFSSTRYLGRNITVSGVIMPRYTNTGGPSFTVSARETLKRALTLVRTSAIMEVDERDYTKYATVQLVGKPLTKFNKANDVLSFNFQLRASDPYKYANTSVPLILKLTTSTGGRVYPRTYNWTYFTSNDFSVGTLTNFGTVETGIDISFFGPVFKPRIELVTTGQFMSFNTTLAAGEVLTVNTADQTARSSSGASMRYLMTQGSSWFTLPPGSHSMRFSGIKIESGIDPVVQLNNKSAWIE